MEPHTTMKCYDNNKGILRKKFVHNKLCQSKQCIRNRTEITW